MHVHTHQAGTISSRIQKSADLGHIDIKQYLNYLGERVQCLHETQSRKISIRTDGDAVQLTVDSALPCVLLVNELYTNAIRHAYSAEDDVRIDVKMSASQENHCRTIVRDYDSEFDDEKFLKSPTTVGFLIVNTLVKQLGAEFSYVNDGGSVFSLHFPVRPGPSFESGIDDLQSPELLVKH